MNQWYAKYGFEDVLSGDTEERARLFREWCFRGYITFLGRARNVSRTYTRKVKENFSFRSFLHSRKIKIPDGYGMARCSLPACYKSISKYDKGEPEIRELLFRRACAWTERRYGLIMGNSRVLSQDEVLVEMDKTSSCGYPWNIKYSSKNDFLADPTVSKVLPDFFECIGEEECDVQAVWKVAQKNELLPIEKIEAGKVRTFTAAPIELSVAANRLFLDQNRKMNANNVLENPFSTSFVGATKYEGGWNRLYKKLTKFPACFELDESSYDASLFQAVFEWLVNFRYKCIDKSGMTDVEKSKLWRKCVHIYSSIVNSLMVLEDGVLCMKSTGNPSGSTNTINDNTLGLDVFFNYAWLCACEDRSIDTDFDHFNANVCSVLNGDDNTFTCSDESVDLLKPAEVRKHWEPLGVITKSPSEEPREVLDVMFLSQHFHLDVKSGEVFPKPDTEKVLASLLFASSTQDIRWHFLRAAALRVESYWNIECRDVIHAYLCFIETEFRSELTGEIKDLKWEHIRALYTSDDDIEALYSGKECGGVLKLIKFLAIANSL